MVRLGGKPMLEHIIERAKLEGFRNFIISVFYLKDHIKKYFGDGKKWDVHINYIEEDKPLGTAGALSLINITLQYPFIVTNGDVITDIKYGDLIEYHNSYSPEATMAVRKHELKNPYGVIKTDGINIISMEEKPKYSSYVNAGIYALEPSIFKHLKKGIHCDMPTLFENLKSKSKKTIVFPMHEVWFDVGNKSDIKIANNFIEGKDD
jgi:NDP-sugar pyrophosphorylase family protein